MTEGDKEFDPNGKAKHEPGAKLDAGKACVYQSVFEYFPRAVEAVATVSDFGARKYTRLGWRSVPDGDKRYADALVRHLIQKAKGEVLDSDSGLPHLAHIAWNSLAVLELYLIEAEK